MSYQLPLERATEELRRAQTLIQDELRAYPTPVSSCDAQYNHMIGQRSAIGRALAALEDLPFVATPRATEPDAGVESR